MKSSFTWNVITWQKTSTINTPAHFLVNIKDINSTVLFEFVPVRLKKNKKCKNLKTLQLKKNPDINFYQFLIINTSNQ